MPIDAPTAACLAWLTAVAIDPSRTVGVAGATAVFVAVAAHDIKRGLNK